MTIAGSKSVHCGQRVLFADTRDFELALVSRSQLRAGSSVAVATATHAQVSESTLGSNAQST
eukprot:CAMPEP_0204124986 /NCGR_PEP_ID=MMETSP0361-20130328/10162_1 /ASSEMBLY_ACC=CAM_ASM_000343 /TAXON_ID=268821 /ORGANISM="Scrippsiella Hangoei, Strain SHTV-5" /LENGTH=61 /DNA_ID=CAMNT_0051076623 /DNA_START=66 /DNA_END=248 /DNA_ORIENTATION=+